MINVAGGGRIPLLEVMRTLQTIFLTEVEPTFGPPRDGDVPIPRPISTKLASCSATSRARRSKTGCAGPWPGISSLSAPAWVAAESLADRRPPPVAAQPRLEAFGRRRRHFTLVVSSERLSLSVDLERKSSSSHHFHELAIDLRDWTQIWPALCLIIPRTGPAHRTCRPHDCHRDRPVCPRRPTRVASSIRGEPNARRGRRSPAGTWRAHAEAVCASAVALVLLLSGPSRDRSPT